MNDMKELRRGKQNERHPLLPVLSKTSKDLDVLSTVTTEEKTKDQGEDVQQF